MAQFSCLLEVSVSEGKISSDKSQSDGERSRKDETGGLSFRLGGRFRAPSSSALDLPTYAPDEDEEVIDQVAKRFRGGPVLGSLEGQEGQSLDEESSEEPVEFDAGLLLTALEAEPEPRTFDSSLSSLADEPTQSAVRPAAQTLQEQPPIEEVEGIEALPMVDVEPLSAQRSEPQVPARGVVCPTCHAESPEGMRFCVECGGSLVQEKADLNFGAEPLKAHQQAPPPTDAARTKSPWPIQLISINEDGSDGEAILLEYLETTVGREGDSRFPSDAFLSPKHARFHIDEGALYIEDLYSLNGTFIKLRDETRLTPGDTILMGRQVLGFERFEQAITPKTKSSDGTRYMGSPSPGGSFKILQIGIGEVVQNVYCLPEAGAVLGREKGDIVFPHDKFMSGRHAQIYAGDDGHCYLVDLNSSNGTWVKIWERLRLENNDYIFMGQQLFRVRYGR